MRNRLKVLRAERNWSQGELARQLGVSRQTVLQRVKRGELQSLHVSRGRRKGLRIKVLENQTPLFDDNS